jgi:hypothetical protein
MIDREPRRSDDDLYADENRDDLDNPGAGTAGGVVGGAAAGAIAGTVIGGPIGTAVGAAIGAVGGAALGFVADSTAGEGIPPDHNDVISTGGTGGVPGAGLGTPVSAPLAGGVGGVGVGATGLPTASTERDEADIERRGAQQGPFDNPASYDETAAEVAQDRPILVGDDPGYEAVRTEDTGRDPDLKTRDYVTDRDELGQGGAAH